MDLFAIFSVEQYKYKIKVENKKIFDLSIFVLRICKQNNFFNLKQVVIYKPNKTFSTINTSSCKTQDS